MPYKTNKNEKLFAFVLDISTAREIKTVAALNGMTVKEAMTEATDDWLEKKWAEHDIAIKSGTGSIGRAAKSPEAYKAALENLRNKHR
jgi:hypothetical protein